MYKKFIVIAAFGLAVGAAGCGSTQTTVNTTANANSNVAANVDTANMPAGLDPNPIQPSGNSTPGIPPAVANLPKGATPTPGIPSETELKKPFKPGVTPTPGIPSSAELRKALGQPANANARSSDAPMMKNSNKLPRKPQ